MKKIFTFLVLIGSMTFAKDLTLEEAIDLTLTNSKEIKISEKTLEISKINLQKAFKNALPSVTYQGKYQRTNFDRTVMIASDKGVEKRRSSYVQNITISQPLFTGGTILSGIKGAKAYENIANYSFLNDKIQMRVNIIQIYSNILNSEKSLDILNKSEEILKKRYDKQKIQLDLGLITKNDLSQTEYSILDVESNIIKVKNQIDTLREQLIVKTGLGRENNLKLIDFKIPEKLSAGIDLEKDLKQAVNESIAARIVKENYKISQAKNMAAIGDLLPKVSAFATYGTTERSKFKNSVDEAQWIGGVQVSWNVFSFGKDFDSYRVAKLELEQQELKEKSVEENIEINVKNAYYTLLSLEKAKESKEKALQVAKVNFEMEEERYDSGLISVIDYLAAENKYRTAQLEYNKILIDYFIAFEKYRSLLI